MGPSIPPATKEHANCQVGLRKGICDNQYYLSIKTNKNRQIGKDIIITFNEDLSTRRVTLTGETTIQVIPDRLHSQKKGQEIDVIMISFVQPDVCERWNKLLLEISGETSSSRGDRKKKEKHFSNDLDLPNKINSEPSVNRKKKEKIINSPIANEEPISSFMTQQPAFISSPLNQQPLFTPSFNQHTSPGGDYYSLMAAIKELHIQNTILNQKVNSLTQDVTILKTLLPQHQQVPMQIQPLSLQSNNPFATSQRSVITSSNPFATNF